MSTLKQAGMAALLIATVLIASCGGGGGNNADTPAPPAPPPAPTGYTLSGTIQAADVSTVDSDSNDPNQTGFTANDTPATAQAIATPVTVVGSVNLLRQGPSAGRNYTVGDAYDWFRVTLKAGQVAELLVGQGTTANNDADLCVVSVDAASIGCSAGTTARECVQAAVDGEYYVVAVEYATGSVYNLRISAPGAGVPCTNLVQPSAAHVPWQLIASHREGEQAPARVQARALARTGGARVLSALGGTADVVSLPADDGARRAALAALVPDATLRRALGSAAARENTAAQTQDDAVVSLLQFHRYAKALQRAGGYAAVEPNWLLELSSSPVGILPASDERYSSQRWHYEQISLPAAMQALVAMRPQPTQRPLVAVLDSGVMLNHPDLAPQLVSRGHAFATLTPTNPGDNDRTEGETLAQNNSDRRFHGTHVAGTVAAASFDSGNASFGAGVAPMAQILPVRVIDPGTVLDIAEGIRYAAGLPNRSGSVPPRRADVINMSLGTRTYIPCPNELQTAITLARAAGSIVVAAAGNEAHNKTGQPVRVFAPANCSGAYAVAATDAIRLQTNYTHSGDDLSFAAPGGDISQSLNGSGSVDGVFSAWGLFDNLNVRRASFEGLQGTSMAAPHVAGVMALMRWVNPALTVAQVDGLLQSGALSDDIGAAGKDAVYGYGLVNARKAVQAAIASRGGPVPADTPVVATPSTLDFGSAATQVTLRLAAPGPSGERIVGITSDSPAVTVRPANVDAGGLGDYTVTVDRSRVGSAAASYSPKLAVALSPQRSFTVQLAFTVAGSTVARGGNVGPLYVLAYDPDSRQTREALATFANGRYGWQISGYLGSRVIVAAGTDLDADDVICAPAEVCGGYPLLGPQDAMTFPVTGNRSDLDFTVAPLIDASAASLASTATRRAAGSGLRGRPGAER